MSEIETKKTVIECECGAHLLVVQNEVEYFEDKTFNSTRFRQEFHVAMFSFGNYTEKPGLWYKLKVMWNYFKTGKMHLDEVILSSDEAKKLADFINENIIESEKY